MYKVFINGFEWWADTTKRILYENADKSGGFSDFKSLTPNELNQLNFFQLCQPKNHRHQKSQLKQLHQKKKYKKNLATSKLFEAISSHSR